MNSLPTQTTNWSDNNITGVTLDQYIGDQTTEHDVSSSANLSSPSWSDPALATVTTVNNLGPDSVVGPTGGTVFSTTPIDGDSTEEGTDLGDEGLQEVATQLGPDGGTLSVTTTTINTFGQVVASTTSDYDTDGTDNDPIVTANTSATDDPFGRILTQTDSLANLTSTNSNFTWYGPQTGKIKGVGSL